MLSLLTLAPFLTLALAADPAPPVVSGDSTVVTNVFIAADPATVRAALADPMVACQLSGDVLDAKVLRKEGDCSVIQMTVRGITSPLVYVAKRCPTADGFRETLLETTDFDAQASTWKLQPVNGGTQVTLQVVSEPRLPIPQRLVNSAVGTSAVQTLKNLVRRVTGR